MALTGYNEAPGRFIPDFHRNEPQPHPHHEGVKYMPWTYKMERGLNIPGGCAACPFLEKTMDREGSPCNLSACDRGVYISTASLVAYRLTR